MSHPHPAAEIVAIALRKIQKIGNKKHQPLLDACQAFLDSINQLFPTGEQPPQLPSSEAAAQEGPTNQPEHAPQDIVAGATTGPANHPAVGDQDSHAADKTDKRPSTATPEQLGSPTPAKAHFEDEDLAEAVRSSSEAFASQQAASAAATGAGEQNHTADSSTAGTAPAAPSAAQQREVTHLPDLVPRTQRALSDGVAIKIVEVLRLAVESERPNIIEVALDCIQKLIAFSFLQGAVYALSVEKPGQPATDPDKQAVAADDPSTRTPQAQAIELMCRCDEVPDEGVELHVLKGLLTATTSPTFTVHGQALLLAVRTCYNIYLMSRSDVNQTTAKATLTQMLNVVFQRMEADDVAVEVRPIVMADMLGVSRHSNQQDAAGAVAAAVQAFLNNVIMVAAPAPAPMPTADEVRLSVAASILSSSEQDVAGSAAAPAGKASVRQSVSGLSDRHSTSGLSTDAEMDASEASGGAAPKRPPPPAPARLLSNITRHPRISSDAVDVPTPVSGSSSRQALVYTQIQLTPEQQARSQVLQKDAFLVFRALCKLSIRTSDQATAQDPTAVRGKVLALELLKVVLENSGPNFRRSDLFLSAIRQYLCVSLLKNSSSSVPAALQLCCSIFLSLMSKFRSHLKAEISVFFPMILLKPFEPPPGPGGAPLGPGAIIPPGPPPTLASLQYKAALLRVLSELSRDGQLLVDLFVNYDCDLESSNLFERMVNGLVKLAQQPPVAQPPSPLIADSGNTYHQEMALRYDALQALVHMVEAMLHWYRLTVGLVEMDLGSSIAGPLTTITAGTEGAEGVIAAGLTQIGSNLRDVLEQQEGGGPLQSTTAEMVSGEDLNAKRAYKQKFQECISLFNKKPKKGIQLLQQEGMLGRDSLDVAMFLLKTQGLDKTMIGDYLGERDDFHIKVMHAYVDLLDFSNLEFDAAIRIFLAGFRLPGEAQKIDRLMEKFAERFVKCNPGSFTSADVAYVLAYSVIMLNTDLHNAQVKKKMTKEGFIRNNRGINDGQDLPEEFLSALYDRIATNEIKMKEELELGAQEAGNQGGSNIISALLTIMGAVRQEKHVEPSEESINRTLEYLHEKAKGAQAVTVTESDAVRPMMEVVWAPLLGALSVLFDEYTESRQVSMCLQGIAVSCCLTALVGMRNLRDVFIHSLCGFTHLHSPQTMRRKNALAFQYLLRVASPDNIGNLLDERWVDVLRCISRWELLQQIASGMPTDAALFAQADARGMKAVFKKVFRDEADKDSSSSPSSGSLRSIESLGMSEANIKKLNISGSASGKKGQDEAQVPAEIINVFDTRELSAVFVNSAQLDSEAVVNFVRALCAVSYDELESSKTPRIFSMTRLVEVAHFNMTRIRLVWSRIWAVLSDYFIHVGCHQNLLVAMYAVDSLRQLAMKFLERDELANYTFQNDFLRPFVVVMRQSNAVEIRELIIRCLSQMVLARVDNVKSGWKSMFMVFTTAAGDKEQMIVNLAFDTIEKIVREHFNHITETETTTFTDCVNCLIAFTNNPHSSTVALNSIAFLRFCAVKLAEGAIGDVDELPEGVSGKVVQPVRVIALDELPAGDAQGQAQTPQPAQLSGSSGADDNARALQPRHSAGSAGQQHLGMGSALERVKSMHRESRTQVSSNSRGGSVGSRRSQSQERSQHAPPHQASLVFVDRDEHVYFWFPLLAGLSELTFDPRDQIRNSALEVLFDTLKAHGGSFAASFWRRVFDSVLMPIFDHVRAEVTDTTTFTSEKRREKEEFWLYETCKRCLQHLIDVFVMFYDETWELLPQMLQLLSSFINRSHQSLAAGGVFALAHLTNSAAQKLDTEAWQSITSFMLSIAQETAPNAVELVTPPSRPQQQQPQQPQQQANHSIPAQNGAALQGSMQAEEHAQRGQLGAFEQQLQPQQQRQGGQGQLHGSQQSTTHLKGRGGMPPGGGRGAGTGYSLREGIGARRLAKFRSQSTVQLLLVQGCSDVYHKQHHLMPAGAVSLLLQALEVISTHARKVDTDTSLRKRLAMQQAEDRVADDRVIFDPPLLRLETESAHAYLSVLLHLLTFAPDSEAKRMCNAPKRMVQLCQAVLTRFALGKDSCRIQPDPQYMADAAAKHQQLQAQAAADHLANGSRGSGFLGVQLGGKSAEAKSRAEKYATAVAAATHGRTADQRSIIVGRTRSGVLVLMAAPSVEFAPFTPLITSTLAALSAFDDATFRMHLHEFFPLMVSLISADYAPVEVLRALADLLANRVGPMIGIAHGEAAAEMAHAAANAKQQAEQQAQALKLQQPEHLVSTAIALHDDASFLH